MQSGEHDSSDFVGVMSPAEISATDAEIDALAKQLGERVKVLVVCLSRSWGGLEQVAANDSMELGAHGLDVEVLCLEGSPLHENLRKRSEVRAIAIDFRPRNYFDFAMKRILDERISHGVNLIHTHQTSLLGSITPWLWKRRDVAVFASRHIMNDHDKRNFFHRLIYGRLDALVVMSQTLRRNVLETHPLRERQVKVVNLGLDFNRFDPATVNSQRQRAEWGADADTLVVGMVGRLDRAKGQEVFIKAAAGLSKGGGLGRPFKFIIVGEETLGAETKYLDELKSMVEQFHLENTVVFAGFQRNIPEIMRAFDIFVMPSRQEAFGLVAIEAMAMECPIIISKGGSAAEIVGQEEFGLMIRPEDSFDLQRQIRYLLDRPEVRIEMGKRARNHVKRHYDRRVRLLKTLELYWRAVRRRQR